MVTKETVYLIVDKTRIILMRNPPWETNPRVCSLVIQTHVNIKHWGFLGYGHRPANGRPCMYYCSTIICSYSLSLILAVFVSYRACPSLSSSSMSVTTHYRIRLLTSASLTIQRDCGRGPRGWPAHQLTPPPFIIFNAKRAWFCHLSCVHLAESMLIVSFPPPTLSSCVISSFRLLTPH